MSRGGVLEGQGDVEVTGISVIGNLEVEEIAVVGFRVDVAGRDGNMTLSSLTTVLGNVPSVLRDGEISLGDTADVNDVGLAGNSLSVRVNGGDLEIREVEVFLPVRLIFGNSASNEEGDNEKSLHKMQMD